MKWYIASKNQEYARLLARAMNDRAFAVNTSWLFATNFGKPKSDDERADAATECFDDIDHCDALVLLTERGEPCKGGMYVEAGYALATGKDVCIIGPRSNTMLHHPAIRQYNSVEEFLSSL